MNNKNKEETGNKKIKISYSKKFGCLYPIFQKVCELNAKFRKVSVLDPFFLKSLLLDVPFRDNFHRKTENAIEGKVDLRYSPMFN